MYGILHRDGRGETDPPLSCLDDLYDELDAEDIEHVSVSVIDDRTGWSLSALGDGRVIFCWLAEPGHERHMLGLEKHDIVELWKRLAAGDVDGLLREPWQSGYGNLP